MFVYLYVESSHIQKVLWILSKIQGRDVETWLPISLDDPADEAKAKFSMLGNKLGTFRQSKIGYSFFIKLLNLNTPDLKIEPASAEIVKLSAMSIQHSVERLDDVLAECLRDRLQVALSDISVKLELADPSIDLHEQTVFDVLISAVDFSDDDFKRSAVRNGLLDLKMIGSVNLKDYKDLDPLVQEVLCLTAKENDRLRRNISFSDFERRLSEGKIQLVSEKR